MVKSSPWIARFKRSAKTAAKFRLAFNREMTQQDFAGLEISGLKRMAA